MPDNPNENNKQRDAAIEERERVRKMNVAELNRLMDRVGTEAAARGMTEEILNDILKD